MSSRDDPRLCFGSTGGQGWVPGDRGAGADGFVVDVSVVLGVLAVAVDRAAAWVAENQLATMAEKEAAQYDVRAADTSVKIGGFGFLPQLAKERFSKVTLTIKQPTFDSIPAEDLKVELHGVQVPRGLLTRTPGTAVTIDTTDVRLQLYRPNSPSSRSAAPVCRD